MNEGSEPLQPSRLSRIDTLWSVVCDAHDSAHERREPAQEVLLHRYGPAIKKYLVASLRDVEQAEEVFQEFALKFIRGDLKHVSPEKGKFRAYVKTVLANLIRAHARKQSQQRRLGSGNDLDAIQDADSKSDSEEQERAQLFLTTWRDELLARTWTALHDECSVSDSPSYIALKYRVEHPAENYEQLGVALSELCGRDIKAGNARVMIHRARSRFAKIMIEQVGDSLDNGALPSIEEELAELGLLHYCREVIDELKK